MRITRTGPALRWAAPVLAAVVLIGAGAAVTAISANARGGLPPRSPAQLLVDVQNAKVHGLSGTVVENADLGLPALPDAGGSGSSDLSSMVSGSHTWRVWYAGPNRMRLALLGSFGESDIVRNGTDLWTWSSQAKSATHTTLPMVSSGAGQPSAALPSGITPQEVAHQALQAITPSTKVSSDGIASVAGRSAYELVLRPRDAGSLVGSVHIAIDGRSHVPTQVQVFAKGASSPAFQVGFTSFSPQPPDASVFRFDPPPNTTIHRGSQGQMSGGGPLGLLGGAAPRIVGKGWSTVLVADLPAEASPGAKPHADSGQLATLLNALPQVRGAWGSGHVLTGTLFSAVLTSDGRVAVGAVRPASLYAALTAR